jgi:hypothetical protein
MSEPDSMKVPTKRRRSQQSKLGALNNNNDVQKSALQRPTSNDNEEWKAYWEAQGQPWRTEQEIDRERQKYLNERRSITPDIKQGIYPFKNIKLARSDVEWLNNT